MRKLVISERFRNVAAPSPAFFNSSLNIRYSFSVSLLARSSLIYFAKTGVISVLAWCARRRSTKIGKLGERDTCANTCPSHLMLFLNILSRDTVFVSCRDHKHGLEFRCHLIQIYYKPVFKKGLRFCVSKGAKAASRESIRLHKILISC